MKNKILTIVTIIVVFAILLLSSSFEILTNMQQIKTTKELLLNINNIILQFNPEEEFNENQFSSLEDIEINKRKVRVTLINNDGDVLFDTENTVYDNHIDREEIKEAFQNGEGYAIRHSDTMKVNYMYYATKINDSLVIRSSVSVDTIKILAKERMQYYFILIIVVAVFSIFLSLRLVRKIVEPVKELGEVTLKMANGDYKIRASVKNKDELGTLAKSFNHMADELQSKINEVIEKQVKLESILNSMESGVIAVDNKNNVISINPCAQLILGIKRNIIGKCISDYITDHDINEFINNEDENDREVTILHPIERNLKIKKSEMIKGIAKVGKVITIQDITDMKRVELMRSQFVANVSHELKTPLTSIKGFSETLRIVKDDATRMKFLDIIDKEAERLTRLINDILELSNIESNLVCDVEEFLPEKIIEEVLSMVSKSANSKNIKIEFNDTNGECILGDRDKFYQLGLNLIENAVRYSKESGGVVKISSYNNEGYYYLVVEDNGIGIPKEDITRIFERFYRVDKSRKQGGTGLGLAIVKHIVKIFNGEINVKSQLGKGSVFEVKIPCV